jgi:hypothetical protein
MRRAGKITKPGKLVIKLRPRCRVSVRQVETTNKHPANSRLDVTAVQVRCSRDAAPRFDGVHPTCKDSHAVPAFLPMPDGPVPGGLQSSPRKPLIRSLQFLQADNIRSGFLQPAQQDRQPSVDPVDVKGRKFHPNGTAGTTRRSIGLQQTVQPECKPRKTPPNY